MRNTEFIINLKDNKAYITPKQSISLEQIDIKSLINSFPNPVSLSFKIKRYIKTTKTIKAEIINYNLSPLDFSAEQLNFSEELDRIDKIVWTNMNTKTLLYIRNYKLSQARTKQKNKKDQDTEPTNTNIHFISIAIKDLTFKDSYAEVATFNKELNRNIKFQFYNRLITPSFTLLSKYLYRELQNRALRVKFEIQTKEDGSEEIKSYADIINNVNQDKIKRYRFQAMKKALYKNFSEYKGESIMDFDHFFSILFDTEFQPKSIFNNEKEFIMEIAKLQKCPHLLKIKYLLKYHIFNIMRIRYIPNPLSLIFLLEKENSYFLVWETIKIRKPTDVWYMNKDAEQISKTIEEIPLFIKALEEKGKKALPENIADNHHRIDYNYSTLMKGFDIWKHEIQYLINKCDSKL